MGELGMSWLWGEGGGGRVTGPLTGARGLPSLAAFLCRVQHGRCP